jgi:hypothetical protein
MVSTELDLHVTVAKVTSDTCETRSLALRGHTVTSIQSDIVTDLFRVCMWPVRPLHCFAKKATRRWAIESAARL